MLKTAKKVVGLKQTLKALEINTVQTVYLAKDAEERVIQNIKTLCNHSNVEIIDVESMSQLGKACGINVGAAVACILKDQ